VTFQSGVSVSSNKLPPCGLTHGCVTTLSESQGCELSDFLSFYSHGKMRHESSVHSAYRVLYCGCF